MLTLLFAHIIQIEEAFHDFLTKEYIRPVHDGEELPFGSFSKMFPSSKLSIDQASRQISVQGSRRLRSGHWR